MHITFRKSFNLWPIKPADCIRKRLRFFSNKTIKLLAAPNAHHLPFFDCYLMSHSDQTNLNQWLERRKQKNEQPNVVELPKSSSPSEWHSESVTRALAWRSKAQHFPSHNRHTAQLVYIAITYGFLLIISIRGGERAIARLFGTALSLLPLFEYGGRNGWIFSGIFFLHLGQRQSILLLGLMHDVHRTYIHTQFSHTRADRIVRER